MASGGQNTATGVANGRDFSRIYPGAPFPLFTRCMIDLGISTQPWKDINEGCERGDQQCLEAAQQWYLAVIELMEQYAQNCRQNKIMLQEDAKSFAQAVAACKEKETPLLSMEQTGLPFDIQNLDMDQKQKQTIAMDETHLFELERRCQDTKASLDKFNRMFTGNSQELYGQMQTETIENLGRTRDSLQVVVGQLEQYVTKWKNARGKSFIKLEDPVDEGELVTRVNRFAYVLRTMVDWFMQERALANLKLAEERSKRMKGYPTPSQLIFIEKGVREVLSNFFTFNILVTVEPENPLNITGVNSTKEGAAKAKEGNVTGEPKNPSSTRGVSNSKGSTKKGAGKKKEGNKSAEKCMDTKKTKSVSTTISFLGGQCFSDLVFYPDSFKLNIIRQADLTGQDLTLLNFWTLDENLKWKCNTDNFLTEKTVEFTEISLYNFNRDRQFVYATLYRICYTVNFSFYGERYSTKALSLPFTMITGSNQKAEHIGSRLWCFANNEDLYSSAFTVPEEIEIGEVMRMLNRYAKQVSGRELRKCETDFLSTQLKVHKKKDGKDFVTFRDFIKEKVVDGKNPPEFNTWFLSVMYSIENLWKGLWKNNFIYGFCHRDFAEQRLKDLRVPVGTMILRPSMSSVDAKNSAEANADLMCALKIDDVVSGDPGKCKILSFPMSFSDLEKGGLYNQITRLRYKKDDSLMAKFLMGYETPIMDIEKLKFYAFGPKPQRHPNYNFLVQQTKEMMIVDEPAEKIQSSRKHERAEIKEEKQRKKRNSSRNPEDSGPSSISPVPNSPSDLFSDISGDTTRSPQVIKRGGAKPKSQTSKTPGKKKSWKRRPLARFWKCSLRWKPANFEFWWLHCGREQRYEGFDREQLP